MTLWENYSVSGPQSTEMSPGTYSCTIKSNISFLQHHCKHKSAPTSSIKDWFMIHLDIKYSNTLLCQSPLVHYVLSILLWVVDASGSTIPSSPPCSTWPLCFLLSTLIDFNYFSLRCLGHSVISISLDSSVLLISTTLLEIRVHACFVSSVPTAGGCELWVIWVKWVELNSVAIGNGRKEDLVLAKDIDHHIYRRRCQTQIRVCHTGLLVKMNLERVILHHWLSFQSLRGF